jgi:hypothetical protein
MLPMAGWPQRVMARASPQATKTVSTPGPKRSAVSLDRALEIPSKALPAPRWPQVYAPVQMPVQVQARPKTQPTSRLTPTWSLGLGLALALAPARASASRSRQVSALPSAQVLAWAA